MNENELEVTIWGVTIKAKGLTAVFVLAGCLLLLMVLTWLVGTPIWRPI
ncbi:MULTISPECIES: hypothetical protein [Rhizobium]|nr:MULTISPECIES: hypothetical protein [Rhizobium]